MLRKQGNGYILPGFLAEDHAPGDLFGGGEAEGRYGTVTRAGNLSGQEGRGGTI